MTVNDALLAKTLERVGLLHCRMHPYKGRGEYLKQLIIRAAGIEGVESVFRRINERCDAQAIDHLMEIKYGLVFKGLGFIPRFEPTGSEGPDLLVARDGVSAFVEVKRYRPKEGEYIPETEGPHGTLQKYGDPKCAQERIADDLTGKLRQIRPRDNVQHGILAVWSDREYFEEVEFKCAVRQISDEAEKKGLRFCVFGSGWTWRGQRFFCEPVGTLATFNRWMDDLDGADEPVHSQQTFSDWMEGLGRADEKRASYDLPASNELPVNDLCNVGVFHLEAGVTDDRIELLKASLRAHEADVHFARTLIVLPEAFNILGPYYPNKPEDEPSQPEPRIEERLKELSKNLGLCFVAGLVNCEGPPYSEAVLIDRGVRHLLSRKVLSDNSRCYECAAKPCDQPILYRGLRLGALICMDAAAGDRPREIEEQARRHAEVLKQFGMAEPRLLCVPARSRAAPPSNVASGWHQKKLSIAIANHESYQHPSVIHLASGVVITAPTDGKCSVSITSLPQ